MPEKRLMPADADRRKLRILWIGAGTYSLILLNGLRFFEELPYQVVLFGTAVNAALLIAFIMTIKKVSKRIRVGDNQNQALATTPTATRSIHRRNIQVLWGAAALYFVLMLVALQYATRLPYQALVLGGVLNMAIVITFAVKLKKSYINRGKQSGA
jgi:hypothetical protein